MKSTGQLLSYNPSHKLKKSWSLKESIFSWRKGINQPTKHRSPNGNGINPVIIEDNLFYQPASKCNVWRALSPMELPEEAILPLVSVQSLSPKLFASLTGPNSGIIATANWKKRLGNSHNLLKTWKSIGNRKAHGLSVSLYEKNVHTGKTNGDPIADSFVIRARTDSAFLAVADGVNWGRESMKAARLATSSVYVYLEQHLFCKESVNYTIKDTRDAAQLLFESFSYAQDQIIHHTTGLTTLCVALVMPLQSNSLSDSSSNNSSTSDPTKFALIVASVGDSRAYLMSKFHGIREITGTVGDEEATGYSLQILNKTRDVRDAGGALGAVYNNGKPELNNLICAVTLCDPGDIILLGSDGLVDNFDPVITGIASIESPHFDYVDENIELDEVYSTNMTTTIPTKSEINDSQISLNEQQAFLSTKLCPSPPQMRIWPAPPPVPDTNDVRKQSPILKNGNHNDCPVDQICANQINFTNQPELTWLERRLYTSKELERVWHELEVKSVNNSDSNQQTLNENNNISSRDLCNALIQHIYDVTSKRRNFLEDPMFASYVKRNNCPQSDNPPTDKQKKWFADTLKSLPGKLDHATVVAHEIGVYHGDENEVYEESAHRYFTPQNLFTDMTMSTME